MDDPPCNCSNRVSIEYLSEGRYRLGDKTLFIRVSAANTHTHSLARSLGLALIQAGSGVLRSKRWLTLALFL